MRDAVSKEIEQLRNADLGWVDRRDAAEALGRGASDAIAALKAHQEDSDRDVKRTVREALSSVAEAWQGAETGDAAGATPLDRMVRAIESPGKRDIAEDGKIFTITVSLPNDRSQTVRVEPGQSQGNEDTIIVWTPCAEANPKAFEWALKNNEHFALCAIAIRQHDGKDTLCMLGSFLAEELTPAELKAAVKEVAFYGDWLEDKLSKGGDAF